MIGISSYHILQAETSTSVTRNTFLFNGTRADSHYYFDFTDLCKITKYQLGLARIMKPYTIYKVDELRMLSITPGRLGTSLKLFDVVYCGFEDLQVLKEMFDANEVPFIIVQKSKEFGLFEITILRGMESFINRSRSQQRKELFDALKGIKNVADGTAGRVFANNSALLAELQRMNDGEYLRAAIKYLSAQNPQLLQDYEEEYARIVELASYTEK